MPTNLDFSEQVVLVTGASGALGSGICERFQNTGATSLHRTTMIRYSTPKRWISTRPTSPTRAMSSAS